MKVNKPKIVVQLLVGKEFLVNIFGMKEAIGPIHYFSPLRTILISALSLLKAV